MSSDTTNSKGSNVGLIALVVGIVGIVIALFGFKQGWDDGDVRPIMSWLIGIGFWLSIAIGMLFLTQIWYVFHARWPTIIRRQCEHGMAAFPYLLVLFLPLLAIPFLHENPGLLWKWMDGHNALPGHGTVGEDPLYQWKSPFLNIPFFAIRAIGIFGVFILVSGLLRRWSFDTDTTGDINNTHKARRLSSLGLFLTSIAMTLGAIDWFKSLEYHWFSTMYGVWFFAASMRAAISTLLILCVILSWKGYLKGILKQSHRYDLGCLMLTFTIFWTYISFSQYFLIYSANIPEETFWYNIREMNFDGTRNSWWWVSMGLIFGHFLTPFLLLLWYKTKVVVWRTVIVAGWILTFHVLDLYWNIVPGKMVTPDHGPGYLVRQFSISPYDIAALIGVGGIFIFAMCRSMGKAEPIPVRDPNILKSLNYSE
ncbi:hypothetical protein SH580_20090 [Coraliomargarita algicola]|uniref:Quinol:cytochrome C oxidoreductase n=1 Tax=Coraliomargarita algicola TaxID=3092156 RepID=A0ABZ0RKV4_9BACT|nr:hypothetical protein [Coraliomargarita sp. J2-16]WPJ95723.1 hypothetical protein SH580_20090 [Coraliomargarita sp. J2-16]